MYLRMFELLQNRDELLQKRARNIIIIIIISVKGLVMCYSGH